MSAERIRSVLCPLDYPNRIVKCKELLSEKLDVDDQTLVMYFLAHAYRQTVIDDPANALRVANEALSGELTPEFRAIFLEVQAMSLHDLGRLSEIPAILGEAGQMELPPSVEGHMVALRGVLLARERNPEAFRVWSQAADIFAAHDAAGSLAWVQSSAAELAIKLGDYPLAREWASRVTLAEWLPLAKLLDAEALYRAELRAESVELADKVHAGEFGPLEAEAAAQICYLRAMFALDAGHVVRANLWLVEATEHMSRLRRRVHELSSAIGLLLARVRGEGVA